MSHSSGKGYWNFFAKASLSAGVSKEIPQISAFLSWNSG
jgi:hypothetical protein